MCADPVGDGFRERGSEQNLSAQGISELGRRQHGASPAAVGQRVEIDAAARHCARNGCQDDLPGRLPEGTLDDSTQAADDQLGQNLDDQEHEADQSGHRAEQDRIQRRHIVVGHQHTHFGNELCRVEHITDNEGGCRCWHQKKQDLFGEFSASHELTFRRMLLRACTCAFPHQQHGDERRRQNRAEAGGDATQNVGPPPEFRVCFAPGNNRHDPVQGLC
mmetsp:Transcript_54018/g.156920  ORF Transcript_54018/g.156920 Transcript_54018/m.156920 type:complete len:219 (+) Transcript_54018:342-998(+)